jgi:energy-coupling factor transporter ATP-binding protein EcfA2
MYIADIEITDLRSFRGTQKISLDRGDGTYAGWTVFAGRNGSGKSTLLKAIAAAAVGPLAIRSLVGGVPDWVREGSKSARIKASLAIDDNADRPIPAETASNRAIEVGLEWSQSTLSQRTVTTFRSTQTRDDARAELGPWSEAPAGWFIAGYGAHRRLGVASAEGSKRSVSGTFSRLINLFSEEATLADAVGWLKTIHAATLEKKRGARALLDSVLNIIDDGLMPEGSTVHKVDSEEVGITRDRVTTRLEYSGDGTRTATALVVDLARRLHACYGDLDLITKRNKIHCPLPGVVLIDQVEAHMHVEWQQKIGFWLTSHFPNIQFLTTSHSPFICQAASPRGIIRLPAPGEDRKMEHLDERLFNCVVNGGADDAVMSQLFGLEHVHSQPAEQLRERAAELELKLVTGVASPSEQREHAKILSVLPGDLGEEADRKLRMVDKASPSAASKSPVKKASATPVKRAPVPTAKKPALAAVSRRVPMKSRTSKVVRKSR